MTLTPRYYSERGFKGDAELEYVFGESSFQKIDSLTKQMAQLYFV